MNTTIRPDLNKKFHVSVSLKIKNLSTGQSEEKLVSFVADECAPKMYNLDWFKQFMNHGIETLVNEENLIEKEQTFRVLQTFSEDGKTFTKDDTVFIHKLGTEPDREYAICEINQDRNPFKIGLTKLAERIKSGHLGFVSP